MSIYRRFVSDNLPSLVTTNTSERIPLLAASAACGLLIQAIYDARQETGFRLLAFSVLPDHLHLILDVPATGPGRALQLIKGRFARAYNRGAGRSGSVWQSRYHERTLRNEQALAGAIEYVHYNPVVAGLVADPQDYPWSSAGGKHETDLAQYLGQAEA